MSEPLVSICCLTYNHEEFISDCLEGFLMQKTNFAIEILIHDDASTDRTQGIIKEYEKKHPDLIKPIYQTENQFSKGLQPTWTFNYPRAQGTFIALCEGDDYWTDSNKLQKQVDFMQKNEDCSFCFHKAFIEIDNQELDKDLHQDNKSKYPSNVKKSILTAKEFYEINGIPTCSVIFKKNEHKNFIEPFFLFKEHMHNDFILFNNLLCYGNAGFINETMATYRKQQRGISYNQYSESYLRKRIFDLKIEKEYFKPLNKNVGVVIQKTINSRILLYLRLFKADNEHYQTTRSLGLKSISFYFAFFHFIIFDKLKYKLKKYFDVSSKRTRG